MPVRPAPGRVIATKAAMGAARDSEDPAMTDRFDDAEPTHAASATAHLLDELQLHGYRPFADEPDPRPLPDPDRLSGAVADIFDALVASLGETRLEPDLPDLLWSLVNLFHRGIDRIGRELDTNEAAQQRSQREQDGSEVRSVELERLLAQGLTLIERRNAFEFLRDAAAEHFEHHTGAAPGGEEVAAVDQVLTVPFALGREGAAILALGSDQVLGVITAMAVGAFSIQYVAFFRLQRIAGPVYLSQIGSVAALFGTVVAVTLLGETIPGGALPAALLIVLGVALFQRPASRRRTG
ncbi:DMT family transporter [Leptolyngbya sp. 15MV]|nr:DMT family transporter [Leptolyngbya sp. 15MV]